MKHLLTKDFRLAMHPTVFMFWLLSAMLLIPNYPYYVVFFYTALGVFFVCLTGRENHDIEYSLTLPVRKRDIVKSRITFAVIVELVQAIVAIPFAYLRQSFPLPGNQVGMDANIAFFGLAFLMLGVFNLVFFTRYYKNPDKVGKAFAIGATLTFVYMAIAEVLTHAVPFFRDKLDTPDPQFIGPKLAVLGIGLVGYAALTLLAERLSEKRFENLDL